MSEVSVTVTLQKPFTIIQVDDYDFGWHVIDAEGEPVAYCPNLPTAELIANALQREPSKDDFVSYTVSG